MHACDKNTFNLLTVLLLPNDHSSAVWRGQVTDDGTRSGELEEEERRQTWQEGQQSAAML